MERIVPDWTAEGPSWSLFGVGDCYLRSGTREEGPLLAPALRKRAAHADLAVANVEAPIPAPHAEPIPKTGPIHASDPAAPERLADAGFDLVTLANNHAMDYGWESLARTADGYEDAGISVVGFGGDRGDALDPVTVGPDGIEVAVLGVCGREFGVAEEADPGTAWAGHPEARTAVDEASRTADTTIVLSHGGLSRGPIPSPMRRDRLRGFTTAGADLVLGHHSHAPQGWEAKEEALVFHCLGDCVFDSHPEDDPTSWGLAIDVTFAGSTPVAVDLLPTEVVDGVVQPLGAERTPDRSVEAHYAFLRRLSTIVTEDHRPHWQEIAVRRYRQTYAERLRSIPEAELLDPDDDPPSPELLTTLNNVRYGSHRAVITTALSVLAGLERDQRDPSVSATVDELLSWTDH